MSEKKKVELFNTHLKQLETSFNERPQFVYRMHRKLFTTMGRTFPSIFAWRGFSGGWIFKGFYAYTICFFLFMKKQGAPYTNREDYHGYDPVHHQWKQPSYGMM